MVVPPPPVDLPTLVAHSRNFLLQSGFPVNAYTSGPISQEQLLRGRRGYAMPGYLAVDGSPGMASLAKRYGRRGRLTPQEIEAARVLLHEGLHEVRLGRDPYTAHNGQQEEAAAESVAQDLLPIFTARLFGQRLPSARKRDQTYARSYTGLVDGLRAMSVFGSGAKKFSDYSARAWRRQYLQADPTARQAMEDKATTRRIAWGKRTGR